MKYIVSVLICLFITVIVVTGVHATVDDPAPGGVGGRVTEKAKKTRDTIVTDFLNFILKMPVQNTTPLPVDPNATPIPNTSPYPTSPSGNLLYPETNYPSSLVTAAEKCLINKNVYIQVESMTDIPAYIIGGMHAAEASCNPQGSCVSGRQIGVNEPDLHNNCPAGDTGIGKPHPLPGGGCAFTDLLDSCVYGANFLKRKIGKTPTNMPEFANALARYNGTGNANCGRTPFQYCPPRFEGSDHVYPMNKYVKSPGDTEQQLMYLVYCADGKRCCAPGDTSCVPPIREKVGVLPMAVILDRYL